MNDEAPRQLQGAPGKSSWLFTAVCGGYFLLGGWAAYKVVPICATFFAGLGISISSGSLLFHLLLSYVLLIVAGVAILVTLALTKQIGNFNEGYRRLVNYVLLIVAIVFAPMVLAALALTLSGPFHLIGKLAQ
ncbi:MAG TPA: hypothetical protein VNT76_20420 [Candidatus Binatus sp.]|nr:hypothetical protein [Candidatus Binatus sp.]